MVVIFIRFFTVFLIIWERDRDRRVHESPHQIFDDYEKSPIADHFCEEAYGRKGHGQVPKSKGTLFN